MDKCWPKESNREASALSCYYVAKRRTVLSRISGTCEVNVNPLHMGMLVEASEVYPDGGLRIRVHDTSDAEIWRKTDWRCHKLDLVSVPTLVWHFLAAVSVPQERARIASDTQLCQETKMLRLEDRIWYQPRLPGAQRSLSVIKYIGAVSELGQGFYFGLELLDCQTYSQNYVLAKKYIPSCSGNITLATICEVRPLEHELSDQVKNSDLTKTSIAENVSLPKDFDGALIGGSSSNRMTNSKKMQRDLSVGFESRSSTFDDTNNNNNNNGDTFPRLNNPLVPKVARQSAKSKIVSNDAGLLTSKNLSDSEIGNN